MKTCSTCSCKIPDDANECPRCGCPVDLDEYMMDNAIDKIKQKRSKRKVIIGLSIVVGVLCVIILVVLLIWNEYENRKRRAEILKGMKDDFIEMGEELNKIHEETELKLQELQEEYIKQEQQNKQIDQ